jgi:hypothetical protein
MRRSGDSLGLGRGLIRRLEGPVDGAVRHLQKEGPVGVARNEADGATGHPFESDASLIVSAHESRAGGGADGSVGVGIGQAHAFAGETIDVRRSDVPCAVASEVSVPRSSIMTTTTFGER